MNLIKRVKLAWKLSKKDQIALSEKLTPVEIDDLPDEDQKAVFFGPGTPEEYKDELDDRKGLKGIFGLRSKE